MYLEIYTSRKCTRDVNNVLRDVNNVHRDVPNVREHTYVCSPHDVSHETSRSPVLCTQRRK